MTQNSDSYVANKATEAPDISEAWEKSPWSEAPFVKINNFRPEGTDHQPDARARLMHDGRNIYGIFNVKDQYVRAVNIGYQARVCRDSCVEVFLQPPGGKPYFNFEFNCGGSLLCFYIEDPSRGEDGSVFSKYTPLADEDMDRVTITHSLPEKVEPEISEPVEWHLGFSVPIDMLEKYHGPMGDLSGQQWRGNFFKCGDQTSHKHWATWQPVPVLNFHDPDCFGKIDFEG